MRVISFLLIQLIGLAIFYLLFIIDFYVICIAYIILLFLGKFFFFDDRYKLIQKYVSKRSLRVLGFLIIFGIIIELFGIVYNPIQLTNRVNIGMYEFDHRAVLVKRKSSDVLRYINDKITYLVDKVYLNRAIQKDPNYVNAYIKLQKLNYNIQKYEEVTKYYDENLRDEFKSNKEIMRIQINSLKYMDRDKEADELYSKYVSLYGEGGVLFEYYFIE